MPPSADNTFGTFLRQLRKRSDMSQADLAAAVGYSIPFISNLELGQRLPDIQMIVQHFIPALGIQDDTQLANRLVELAAASRGQRPPTSSTVHLIRQPLDKATNNVLGRRLPLPPTELIGRAEVVAELCDRLSGHSGRVLTLLGPPGIGKTTLALAVAMRAQDYYPDGAVFVPLAGVNDSIEMAGTLVAALIGNDENPKLPKTRLIEFLRRKSILLVLDNLEQIPDAALLVAELVVECPGLHILATSRERLHLRAEQRFKVLPLALEPAVRLFAQRAQAVDSDFSLTPNNLPTIEAICQRLDCLPLALELCAAQIVLLSPAKLLAQLQDRRLDLLVEGAADLPPRQRTLRIAIGSSYDLLDEGERSLLRSLGVFVGGFDLEAVEAVWAWRQETLARTPHSLLHALIGKSLVQSETAPAGEQRFMLLETIREYALEQLRAHEEERSLRMCHYSVYLNRMRSGDNYLRGSDAAAWFVRLEPDLDNLRAALRWALDEAHFADAAWLLLATSYFWNMAGHGYEEARWLSQLLPNRHALATNLRLAILLTFFRAAFSLDEFQPTDRYLQECMLLLEDCPHRLLHAATWSYRAFTAPDGDQTLSATERAIALTRLDDETPELGAEFGALADRDFLLAMHLLSYATLLIDRGEIRRAAPCVAESLDIFRARSNRIGIGEGLGTLGRLALLHGDISRARKLFQEVVEITPTLNHPATRFEWRSLLAMTVLYDGDMTGARQLLTESLLHCHEQKNMNLLAQVNLNLAELALCDGLLDEAEHALVESLASLTEPRQITLHDVERLWIAARLAAAQGHYQHAATLFGKADQAHSQVHYAIAGPMLTLADAAITTVRDALGPVLFAEAFATGQQLSFGEAFASIVTLADITRLDARQ